MTNIEILDNIELDIDNFFKKKHIKAYNIDSWTDKKSERTFNYTYEINKKVDSGALYDYLFSESDVLLHNLDMEVKIIYLENIKINIIISVPNELAESKKSARKSLKESNSIKTVNDFLMLCGDSEQSFSLYSETDSLENVTLDEIYRSCKEWLNMEIKGFYLYKREIVIEIKD